jgi:hypothetical protein
VDWRGYRLGFRRVGGLAVERASSEFRGIEKLGSPVESLTFFHFFHFLRHFLPISGEDGWSSVGTQRLIRRVLHSSFLTPLRKESSIHAGVDSAIFPPSASPTGTDPIDHAECTAS